MSNTININGVKYMKVMPSGDWYYVVTGAGWVLVGILDGKFLRSVSTVRSWSGGEGLYMGITKHQSTAVFDKSGDVEIESYLYRGVLPVDWRVE